jgi:hypothetical protein
LKDGIRNQDRIIHESPLRTVNSFWLKPAFLLAGYPLAKANGNDFIIGKQALLKYLASPCLNQIIAVPFKGRINEADMWL